MCAPHGGWGGAPAAGGGVAAGCAQQQQRWWQRRSGPQSQAAGKAPRRACAEVGAAEAEAGAPEVAA